MKEAGCKKAETVGAEGDLCSWRGELGCESGKYGQEVLVTFSIELLLLLKSTLHSGDLIL